MAVAGRHREIVLRYFGTNVPFRKLARSLSGCSPARFVPNTGCCLNGHSPGRTREVRGKCSTT